VRIDGGGPSCWHLLNLSLRTRYCLPGWGLYGYKVQYDLVSTPIITA
jgi:hypothetical protein